MARTATAQKRAHRTALRKRTDRNALRSRASARTGPRGAASARSFSPEISISIRTLGTWPFDSEPVDDDGPWPSEGGDLPANLFNPFSPAAFDDRLVTPRAPWSPAVSALRLTADELQTLWTYCARWVADQPMPEHQLDLWGRLVDATPDEPEVDRAMAVLEEWLLIDAPWPGGPAPLVALAATTEAEGQPRIAAGLRAVADARLEVFTVVFHGSDGRIGVRHLSLGAAWPDIITVRVPPSAQALPPEGVGIAGRLLPDVGGGFRFSEAWLLFTEPPCSLVSHDTLAAPGLLRLWIRERRRARNRARPRPGEAHGRRTARPFRPGRGIDWRV